MQGSIEFFYEEVEYRFKNLSKSTKWIKSIIQSEGFQLKHLNYILCSDTYLHDINKEYLDHDTYTDILTFNQSDDPALIESDIYISIDRILDNSENNNEPFEKELHRVMIHGVLHLIGFNDKTPEQKMLMRKKEDTCLSLHDW